MIHFRRIITLFITAALLLPYLLTANAEESYDNTDGYYIYNVMYFDSISDYGAFITGITNTEAISGDIVISDTLGGYPVIGIADATFAKLENLTSVTIPDSVSLLGNFAFYGCYNLKSVNIPGSISRIDKYTFDGCSSLTNINIGDGVAELSNYAFGNCCSLSNVFIPKSVYSVSPYTFDGCSSLTSINVSEESQFYSSEDGILFNKDKSTLVKFPQSKECEEYTPSESVTAIDATAFSGCVNINRLCLPVRYKDLSLDMPYQAKVTYYCNVEYYYQDKLVYNEKYADGEYLKECSGLPAREKGCKYAYYVSGQKVKPGEYGVINDLSVTIRSELYYCTVRISEDGGNSYPALVPIDSAISDFYHEEEGHTYSYTLNGKACDNTAVIFEDTNTLEIEKNRVIHTVTFIGDWDSTQYVKHGDYVEELPFPDEEGYEYTYTIDGKECDAKAPVTSDLIITVKKSIITYTVTFTGDWNSVQTVNYGDTVKNLPEAEEGYRYVYRDGNGYEIDMTTPITYELNISVTLTKVHMVEVSVYFLDGREWSDTQYVDHGGFVENLPEVEYGHYISYNLDGNEWSPDTPVTSNLKLVGKEELKIYTVTFIGDWNSTQYVMHGDYVDKPPYEEGYTYTYTVSGNEYNPNTAVTSDLIITVKKSIITYTVIFNGAWNSIQTVNYGDTVKSLPEAEEGYHYKYTYYDTITYTECEWTPYTPITSDMRIIIKREINTYTVTFYGDVNDTQIVQYNGYVNPLPELDDSREYLLVSSGKVWDINTPITSDLSVRVSIIIKSYTVTFTGDLEGEQTVYHGDHISAADEDGYIFSYTVDGKEWSPDTPITSDLTVHVTKTAKVYTVTFIGDWSSTESVSYGNTVTKLAENGDTYIYKYLVNSVYGKEWSPDTPVTSDMTIYVKKVITAYIITFTGDFEGTQIVDINGYTEPLPAKDGYVYQYTDENNRSWSPSSKITRNMTIRVKAVNDRCNILGIKNSEAFSSDSESYVASAVVYNKKMMLIPMLSDNASCVIKTKDYRVLYDSQSSENSVIELSYGINEYYLTVTAESGRTVTYNLDITLERVNDLGFMTALTYGTTIGFQPSDAIKGNPSIKAKYSKNNTDWKYVDAEYNPDINTIYVKNMESSSVYYFIIEADYGYEDFVYNTNMPIKVKTGLSDECLIICSNNPPSTKVDHENGTVSGLWVQNVFDTCDVDITVSAGATWEMFLTPDMNVPVPSKTVSLEEGKTTNVYIRVTAEDKISTKIYTLPIYRWTKSDKPVISIENGLVKISARKDSIIYYTMDNSYPTPGAKNTIIYTKPFMCTDRTNIKAIAKDRDKDETSEPVGFEVRGAAKTAVSSAVFSPSTANEYSYEVYLETLEASGLNGSLYIAAYDNDGILLAIETASVSTADNTYVERGRLHTNVKPTAYTVYFLDSSMKPLAPAYKQ